MVKLRPLRWIQIKATGKRLLFQWQVGQLMTENDSNPSGRSSSESAFLKTRGRCLKIGTWNVRTLYQPGRFENLIQEMQNVNLDILGIAETHWTEEGKIIQENHTMIYSGGEKHRNGVGIVMKNSVAKSMMGFWAISDRVIMMKLEAKPFNINVMQVYAPTQDHDDEGNRTVLSRNSKWY